MSKTSRQLGCGLTDLETLNVARVRLGTTATLCRFHFRSVYFLFFFKQRVVLYPFPEPVSNFHTNVLTLSPL